MMTYFGDVPPGSKFRYEGKLYKRLHGGCARLIQSNGIDIIGTVVPFGPETEVEFEGDK